MHAMGEGLFEEIKLACAAERAEAASRRRASRHAKRDWQEASPDVRAMYERIARRWADQDDFKLWEFADEYGVRRDFLKRAALGLGMPVTFGNPQEARA